MTNSPTEHFLRTPWCQALIQDPDWIPVRTHSRISKPIARNTFFAETLATESTVRQLLSLRPKELSRVGVAPIRELRTIVDVGEGVNGHPRTCHGGFVATLLDEVCGVLMWMVLEERRKMGEGAGMTSMTAYLNTSYRKPAPAPGILLCTAKFERQEGKKAFISGTIEDGMGTVYSTAEAMFVQINTKL